MSYNSKYTGAEVEALLDAANGKQDAIADLDAIRAGAAAGATALQSVPSEYVTESELTNKGYATTSALDNKVDKVSGKQLSTEDFTTALKTKLQGLINYDDTAISDAVASLQAQINTLVSGNANDAINSFNEIIAFLEGIKDTQDLASIIASIEQQIAGKMDKVTLATVATSGSYNDLSNKPTIPSAVTESTVSGWGFTKNTGTYSKPSTGIPKSDLASAVQASLGKADTALQSYTEQYKGTVTGVKVNGSTKNPSNGVVDLGTLITKHQEISISGDNNSGRPYLFIDTESVDGGLAIGVDATIDIADATEYGELADAYAVQKYVDEYVNAKQDQLVSGTNIKTINGESLLGSGNITISGGGGTITGVSANGTSVATSGVANIPAASTSAYGVTKLSSATNSTSTSLAATASAVKAAYDLANSYKGTVTGVKINGTTKSPTSGTVDLGTVITAHQDISGKQDKLVSGTNIKTINGTSLLGSGNIVISGGGGSSSGGGAYPEVDGSRYEEVNGIYACYDASPNTFYVFPECASLAFFPSDDVPQDGLAHEYLFQFTSGATAASLILPDDIKWTEELVIEPNRIYQVSILKGLASVLSWDNAPEVEMISFNCMVDNLQAEAGMTWNEWVNSSYNNGKYGPDGELIIRNGDSYVTYQGSYVNRTDAIIPNAFYNTEPL